MARTTLYQLAVRGYRECEGMPNDRMRAALRGVGLDPDLQVEEPAPLVGLIRAAIPAWEEGDMIDVNREYIAKCVEQALRGVV